ncbi:hypothetical protein ACJRO7_014977 [Eucalyptus globulus]|uniref:Uncharacterized protein n=1 Tax=Eucalyptus globulus TaxID=34317 RepID=A0ABD3L2Z7_EUCGL
MRRRRGGGGWCSRGRWRTPMAAALKGESPPNTSATANPIWTVRFAAAMATTGKMEPNHNRISISLVRAMDESVVARSLHIWKSAIGISTSTIAAMASFHERHPLLSLVAAVAFLDCQNPRLFVEGKLLGLEDEAADDEERQRTLGRGRVRWWSE